MRTPGHDIDLVHGLLHAEGVIATAADIRTARYCAGADDEGRNSYNVVDLPWPSPATPRWSARACVMTSSACGICGTDSIEQLQRRSRYVLAPGPPVARTCSAAAPVCCGSRQRRSTSDRADCTRRG